MKEIITKMFEEILLKILEYNYRGSDWYFREVKSFEIHTIEYKPMRGSSYIPLPEFIKKKNAIINMENKDDKCFLWCVLRYLHPREKKCIKNK